MSCAHVGAAISANAVAAKAIFKHFMHLALWIPRLIGLR
jgi:hypothetical protein